MSIGERIMELRRDKDISQGQLAQLMGVSRQAVSKWENDHTSPDTLNLVQLAQVLGTWPPASIPQKKRPRRLSRWMSRSKRSWSAWRLRLKK